jgi:hypothetical protein
VSAGRKTQKLEPVIPRADSPARKPSPCATWADLRSEERDGARVGRAMERRNQRPLGTLSAHSVTSTFYRSAGPDYHKSETTRRGCDICADHRQSSLMTRSVDWCWATWEKLHRIRGMGRSRPMEVLHEGALTS